MVPSPAVALTVTLAVSVAPTAGAAPAAAAMAAARAAAPSSATARRARIENDLPAGMPGGLASMLISLRTGSRRPARPVAGGPSKRFDPCVRQPGSAVQRRPPPAPGKTTNQPQNVQFTASATVSGGAAAERGVKCNQGAALTAERGAGSGGLAHDQFGVQDDVGGLLAGPGDQGQQFAGQPGAHRLDGLPDGG